MPTEKAMTRRIEVIEKLRQEVAQSDNSLLDLEIVDSSIVTDAVEAFRVLSGNKKGRCNIPISSVISIGRKNDTWMEGDTWRKVVTCRLHGENWPETVFEYFENEIGTRLFPTPGAGGWLELYCYGGLSVCSNGNHRLAAAYCWLASTRGNDAQLKDIITTLVPIDQKKVQMVLGAIPDSCTDISVCTTPTPCLTLELPYRAYIRTISKTETAYYALSEGLCLLWPARRGVLERVVRFLSSDRASKDNYLRQCLELQNWSPLPRRILDAWARCEWFNDVYENANSFVRGDLR